MLTYHCYSQSSLSPKSVSTHIGEGKKSGTTKNDKKTNRRTIITSHKKWNHKKRQKTNEEKTHRTTDKHGRHRAPQTSLEPPPSTNPCYDHVSP